MFPEGHGIRLLFTPAPRWSFLFLDPNAGIEPATLFSQEYALPTELIRILPRRRATSVVDDPF